MGSDRPRGDLWDLPQCHALHPVEPVLGAIRADGAWALPLGGAWARLGIPPTPDALSEWARSPQVEQASPWGGTAPAWVLRARTCVRWIETRPRLVRKIAWTDGQVAVHTLPKRVDARAIRLDPAHRLHPGTGEWLASPTPEGAEIVPLGGGRSRRVPLTEIDTALARDMGGHPQHAAALHHLGLRWDGEEIYLDCLREATHHVLEAPDLALSAADGVRLRTCRAQADRVYWQGADPVTWVLPHPVLARLPHTVRHLPAQARPSVELTAWALDNEGDYLGVWRTLHGHSQLELWSVRAHDRLKAWPFRPAEGARLVLRRPEPGHLPAMWALHVVGNDVEVSEVEFGDTRVTAVGRLVGAAVAAVLEPAARGEWTDGVRTYPLVTSP